MGVPRGGRAHIFKQAQALLAVLFWATTVCLGASSSTNAPATPGGPQTNPPAIALVEIASEAEATLSNVQGIQAGLSTEESIWSTEQNVSILSRELTARLEEDARIISRAPSLGSLRRLDREWRNLGEELANCNRALTKQATRVETDLAKVSQWQQRWELTRNSPASTNLPPEVQQRIETVLDGIQKTREQLSVRHAQILVLQNQAAEQHGRVAQALSRSRKRAPESSLAFGCGIGLRSGKQNLWEDSGATLGQGSPRSLTRQMTALAAYAQRKKDRFLLHGLILTAFIWLLFWARRTLRRAQEPDSVCSALILDAPILTSAVLTFVVSGWLYPQAPRLLWALLGALGLVPTTLLLRRLMDRHLLPILWALMACYFVDQLRRVAAAEEFLARSLFVTEMLAGTVFVGWLIRSEQLCGVPEAERKRLWKSINLGARVALGLFLIAALANTFGFVSLSKFIGNAVLSSAYLAVVVYGVARIMEDLTSILLRIGPLSRLPMIRGHRPLFQIRIGRVVEGLGIILWIVFVLETLSLRAPLYEVASN